MPFDHVAIFTLTREETLNWYLAALKPLGYTLKMTVGAANHVHGLGAGMVPDFWIAGPPTSPAPSDFTGTTPLHLAFATSSRRVVREFHKAALAAGGKCNGAPGVRAQYHRFYYGAFVLDGAGNNVEVVCHYPPVWAEAGVGTAVGVAGVLAGVVGWWWAGMGW